ncbi:MAG: glutathione S-transferase N-terminal domain-containing protein [Proteobacteria bacterium]|jgi:glutaredoxin 3|nr:glutathione S-transferase N-terminal domain-containing protein [Pseudomonadota bacterium]
MSSKVVMYTKDPCPYCDRARTFLENKGVTIEEIDLTGKEDEINEIKLKTGWRTVPIILINGKLVGGYTDIKALEEEGELDKLLGIS